MEDERKSSLKASTIKRWDNRWIPSEAYDSSGTTSTSEAGEEYPDDYHASAFDTLGHHNQTHNTCKSHGCLCQLCLLGYARVIALQGSLTNVCAAANVSHLLNSPLFNTPCSSVPADLAQRVTKEMSCNNHGCNMDHRSCSCCQLPNYHQTNRNNFIPTPYDNKEKIVSSNSHNNRCVGSLDRRKRRMKNKIDRDHRTKSQSDLICCDQKNKPQYCSLQQFNNCGNNHHSNNHCNNTEERLRKLENERSALHMEISILSEQVEAQSGKIIELENALQEKKNCLRNMEESLQKEVLCRSALETQKLELLSSLSEMKLRQASLEHENLSLRSAGSLNNSERFSRHAGHYSSLPRPPTSTKKGVAFGKTPNMSAVQTTNILAVKGISSGCLSAPLLADEDKIVAPEPVKVFTRPFSQLSIEEVGEWLSHLGLDSYTNELKRWGATGNKLLESSTHQLEKELDLKNVLHRKKFFYALESERSNGAGFCGSDQMDNAAVLRWLDDIGLPQHKEAFHNAKVDGRVLHRLTTEDLLVLNVTAQLHVASLRRGIQVLRQLNFEFDNLERRSANSNGQCEEIDKDYSRVPLWTNHRVMEWLRVVDLSEYAPNMRGSGVHGGLMVYEPRFTSELLATLLSIPPAKTLLRRHLTTHFNQIVGREVVQQKRDMENTLGFTPLTLTARIKVPKRTQFTLKRKKSKNEIDFGNLVCPLEGSPPVSDSEMAEKRVIGCI